MTVREHATATAKIASVIPGNIFTDGSRLPTRHCGCSLVCMTETKVWNRREFHLGNRKEILDAELYAIAKALKETIERHIKIFNKRLIRIFTDSEWALRSIQDDVRGPGQWLV